MSWTLTILLHRPYISALQYHPESPGTSSSLHPHKICHQAANKICFVLEKYAPKIPGMPNDKIFSIFLAASIFLYHVKVIEPDNFEVKLRLRTCLHWLDTLARTWLEPRHGPESHPTSTSTPNMLGQHIQQHLQQETPTKDRFTDNKPHGMNVVSSSEPLPNQSHADHGHPHNSDHTVPLPLVPQIALPISQSDNALMQSMPIPLTVNDGMATSPSQDPNSLSGAMSLPTAARVPDWSFLNDFGDAHDAEGFWDLDRALRDLLHGRGGVQTDGLSGV